MAKSPFRSEQLVYRSFEDTPEDDAFMHSLQSDPWAWGRWTSLLMKPQSKNETVNYLKQLLSDKALLGVIICLPACPSSAPTEANDGETESIPIGMMKLRAIEPGQQHHRESYIGIKLLEPYRGKGYGSEAINWLLRWGFCVGGLHRISIETFSNNPGACRLYERLGFVPEGRRRKSVWFNGEWYDRVLFGMLEEEWRTRKDARNFEEYD